MRVEVTRFPSLDDARRSAVSAIDAASVQRLARITNPGLIALGEAALREAERFQSSRPGAYPFLQAAVDAGEAADLAESAAKVMAEHAAFETIGAQVRKLRLQAKREVSMATTQAEVAQRRDQAVADIAAL